MCPCWRYFFLSLIHPSRVSHLMLCDSFSPSLPVVYHRYSGICPEGAAGGAEWCKVHFCPPVRACLGPGGTSQRTRTVLLSDAFQSMKDMVGSVGGVLGGGEAAKMVGDQTLNWGTTGCVWYNCRKHRLCPLSSSSSLLVPFRPVPWGAAGQANAPAWNPHPRARRLSPPSLRFYRNTACATHAGVHLHRFKRGTDWDI